MKIFTTCLFISLLATLSIPARAQSSKARINGHIIDEANIAAGAATVMLIRSRDSSIYRSAISDDKGFFDIENISSGSYLVRVTKVGYGKTYKGPYQIGEGTIVNTGDIVLMFATTQLKGVTVAAKKDFVEVHPDKTVLNVDQNVMAAGNSVYELLQTAPGVKVSDDKILYKSGQKALIAINGRPVNLPDEQLANLLKGYQSSAISQVELIQNPSAKYDAASAGGVINIILKKNKDLGVNASVIESAGYGDKYRASTGLNINWRTQKVNVFANYSYTQSQLPRTWHIDRSLNTDGGPMDFGVDYRSVNTLRSNNFNVGADYAISPNQTLGAMVYGNINNASINKNNITHITNNGQVDSVVNTHSDIGRDISSVNYNLNYKIAPGKLQKTTLAASVDYLTYRRKSEEDLQNMFLAPDGASYRDPVFYADYSPANIDVRAEKIDLTQKLSKTATLDAGVKNSQVNSNSTIDFTELINGSYQKLPALTDHFIYNEQLNQGYVNYTDSYGKLWHLTAGLRGEQTISSAHSFFPDRTIHRKYFDLFPDAQLSYDANKDHHFTLLYNRHIERPNYQDLNPFVAYVDQYFYSTGNPFLQPQYISTIEVSDFIASKYKFALRRVVVDNFYAPIFQQNDSTKVYTTVTANIATRYIYQTEWDIPINPTRWWVINLNVKASLERYVYTDARAGTKNLTDLAFDVPQTFTISPRLKLDVRGYYETPTYYGIKEYKALYFANGGISYSILQNAGSIKLAVTDAFNSYYDRYSTHYINLDITAKEKSVRRMFQATFTYRFGKRSVKNVARHSMGNSDEQSRLSGSRNEN